MPNLSTTAMSISETQIGPYVHGTLWQLLTVGLAIAVTMILSGWIIQILIGKSANRNSDKAAWVMGKAENVIVVLFCLAGELTGIAILISAKALVRKGMSGKEDDTSYRVAGTLTNLAWSLLIGLTARVLIFGI